MPMMSFKSDGIRVEETVRVKICELRNLPARSSGSPKSRSAYCALNLDQEQIYTTAVVKNNLNPYFGAETQFEVPRQFRFLNVYVYDKNDPAPNGTVNGALGKVAIAKKDLQKFGGKDQWFPIIPIDADSEVKGKIHLEVAWTNKSLTVRIKKCDGLTLVNRNCDSFAQVTVENPGSSTSSSRLGATKSFKTKTWRKTVNPEFNETFHFDDEQVDYSTAEIKVSVWHESSGGLWGNVFLGEIRIPVQTLDGSRKNDLWYFLNPRDSLREKFSDQGSIRLNIRYNAESIISPRYYEPLRKLILSLPDDDSLVTASAAFILGEICEDKMEVAKPIVRIFLKYGQLLPLIRALGHLEMNTITDVSTLFRGNTLLSKCVDETMRLGGKFYLESFMKDHIDRIFLEQKYCEIDPVRLADGGDLNLNMLNLVSYIEPILTSITSSALSCPSLMSEILSELKQSAKSKYPERREIHYSVVAGFILLRFVAPAILNPELFDLRKEGGRTETVTRTLTLVSKAVQSVGNCLSNESNKVLIKESYMEPIMTKFCSEPYLQSMKVFLDTVSSTNVIHSSFPVKLKEGILTKRAQGRSRFGWKNFKRRYFCLTTQELRYSRSAKSNPLGRIPVSEIQSTQFLTEGSSFDLKNMFQVILSSRQLYIQARHSVEAKEWKDALDFVASRNHLQRERNMFHPDAFIGGHWRCCKGSDQGNPGCREVPSFQVPVDIDVNREVEKVQSLLLKNMEKLSRLHDHCHNDYLSLHKELPQHIQDLTASRYHTLTSMQACVTSLEQEHRHHVKQMYQRNVYGSEHAPIGEDTVNYAPTYQYIMALVGSADRPSPSTPPEITRC
ncbi:Ras GTPase-activating protein 3 [Hypsibius exemplaris]|uniref:Ras GTPase-activating protein 3 n=1 Tax=Hypsibius exemplaris TaxID=2072580 RepID=A0A1W0WCE7_HYPEX|nr:Ras GTPase-activating protein 3 [Hypsibius exemplaris]